MAFLKRRVLAHLVADGELVKLTRERWERTTGAPLPPQVKGEEGESAFVWVDSRRWEELARRKAREGPPLEVRAAPRRPEKDDVERELDRLEREEGSSAPWSE
ncbi:uncharacterized protein RHOBADRAFT_43107 [Rhodotorula graminis WP1]|uniref:Uncharacterized protein n=1 Tax=Rhodotorula graminis (strain WP1) TaxID=578459 RepID=A0A194S577_RHOGW|nr:uncharacterized protein RHOBADRAFT_43107 [Rhodotorula graminis WP1]KPV75684.1 hypothetical protein RHOBADRAFT_43107 [Rhodotorula graminis WP1]